MYEQQFIQVLETGDLYNGDAKHATLRFFYKDIIDSIKHTGVLENSSWITVQLTKVDEEYVKSKVIEALDNTDREVGEYSNDEIIKSVFKNTDRINEIISKDIKDADYAYSLGVQPVFTRYSVDQLREKNLLD